MSDDNPDPIAIRDDTARRLSGLARYFPEGRPAGPARIRRSFILPEQDDQLPCLQVYFAGNSMSPDGDANAGEPSFIHTARIAVAGILKADEVDDLDDQVAAALQEHLEILLRDVDWLDQFEAVEGVEQSFRVENSNYLAAIALTVFTISFRTAWEPRVPGEFAGINLRTPAGAGATYPAP